MNWFCPICKKSTDSKTHFEFPFCSERRRLLDLGNWASDRYVISGSVIDESVSEKPDPNETEP